VIRLAVVEDLPGILECLSVLSDVKVTNWLNIEKAFNYREESGVVTFVCQYNQIIPLGNEIVDRNIIGTASLFIQRKLSHDGGSVGIIEDVAVHKDFQGIGIGKDLIRACIDYSRRAGLYKVILNCVPDKVCYYEKFGFQLDGLEMRLNLSS
jgi:glucosamine-phosphate N-acetyltransferase